jgi:hypothetical protein
MEDACGLIRCLACTHRVELFVDVLWVAGLLEVLFPSAFSMAHNVVLPA